MSAIAFPASVVPAGYTVAFDVPKFLHPESIIGVQGTSVPGTATENGRTYHFWFQRHPNGEVFNFGLSCNGQPIRNPSHKLALRAIIREAYDYATRARDLGVQHDAHCKARPTVESLKAEGRFAEAGALAYRQGAPCQYGCHYGMRSTREHAAATFAAGWHDAAAAIQAERGVDTGEQHDAHVSAFRAEEMVRNTTVTRGGKVLSSPAPRRACAMRASADATIVGDVPSLPPLYTLARVEQQDFAALWASIPPAKQVEIGAMVLRQECANQVALDGGFNTTADDRGEADSISNEILNTLPKVIEAAIPDELPVLYDDPYPLWMILGDRPSDRTPLRIHVRGLPSPRRPVHNESGWCVRARGGLVELGGALNIGSRDPDADPVWEYVTAEWIEAERRRRHPEQFAA